MNHRINCWEYTNCGMEPGGIFAQIYGPCPVPKMMKYDGINGGRGAGRACWMIMNNSRSKGPFVCKNSRLSCCQCEFFRRVHNEEEIIIIGQVPEEESDNFLIPS
jgi:hypothetical protein